MAEGDLVYSPIGMQDPKELLESTGIWCPVPEEYVGDGAPRFEHQRGVLVLYLQDKAAQEIGALSQDEAISYTLNLVANTHATWAYNHVRENGTPGRKTDREALKAYDMIRDKVFKYFETGHLQAWGRQGNTMASFGYQDTDQLGTFWSDLRDPIGPARIGDYTKHELKHQIKKKTNESGDCLAFVEAWMAANKGSKIYSIEAFQHTLLSHLSEKKVFLAGENISWTLGWIQGAMTSSLTALWKLYWHATFDHMDGGLDLACQWLHKHFDLYKDPFVFEDTWRAKSDGKANGR